MKIQLIILADGKGTDGDQDSMERKEGYRRMGGKQELWVGEYRLFIIYLVNNNRLIEHLVGPGIIQDDRRESEGVY